MEVASHLAWVEANAARATRRREVSEAWKRERGELLTWAKQRFADARAVSE